VLELADRLALTATQRTATEAVFRDMQAEARALGERLVEEERALDRAFADKTVTADRLRAATSSIAALNGRLREVHLRAHLAQARILSGEQSLRYAELRGYANAAPAHRHGH
jgi:Spy/CpxP family protein refolding chaperone